MCKYHSSCYFNESDNSCNDVNIPYGHALLLDSDDLLYSNNFSISSAHLYINTMPNPVVVYESEGTDCVVVVSGSWFESFFYFYFCTCGHALVTI